MQSPLQLLAEHSLPCLDGSEHAGVQWPSGGGQDQLSTGAAGLDPIL